MSDEDKTKTLCPIPWNHTAIYQTGQYGICCQCVYSGGGRLSVDDVPSRLTEVSIDDIRNHPTYVELRKSMLDGEQHSLCKLCWDEEALGRRSKRQNVLDWYPDTVEKILESKDTSGVIDTEEFPVKYFDLRLGNLCNLACRSCGAGDSSLWVEYVDGTIKLDFIPKIYNIVQKGGSKKIDSDDFLYYKTPQFSQMLEKALPNVDRIYFTGGEPLINKQHYEILDYCIEKGYAGHINLEYNTNGTTLNPALLEQWKHFKHVDVCWSLDAMGPLAEYVRFPSNWDDIIENLRLFDNVDIPHLTGHTNCTVSILNIMQFPEFFTWFYKQDFKKFYKNLGWHRLVFPRFMNVQILPKHIKQEITNYYDDFIEKSDIPDLKEHIYPIIDFMNQADQSIRMPECKINIKKQDKLRNQDVRDYVPWLAEVFDQPSSWLA